MSGRFSAAALAVLLAASSTGACAKSSHSTTAGRKSTTGTTVLLPGTPTTAPPAAHGANEPSPTLVDPKTGKQGNIGENDLYTASSPPSPKFRQADLGGVKGDVPLTAKITPPCAETGQTVTIVFHSEPGMTIAAQMKWPNDQFSGLDNTRGTSDSKGSLTWTVEVKPTALYGVADLMAAAIDESDTGRKRSGSTGNWEFVVAPPGRC
ncbi:MAG: hypothetical protein QOK43_1154 [Acidimicrobiaceae bacterium]|nr:hypothetical protein [Acidimicrobiaceae bacterium]MDQ1444656.1 hypothetical protein [Acidimicrobiaceae bacterium]